MNVALSPLNVLSLCAGTEGLGVGFKLAVPSARTVGYLEIDAYACAVLEARIAEGALDDAPIWTNLKTFDGKAWRGAVDCVLAGFPCQPFSTAGKRGGASDPRHLWPDVARVIGEIEPSIVFLENVPGLVSTLTFEHRPDIMAFFRDMAAAIRAEKDVRRRWHAKRHRDRLYRRLLREQGVSALLHVCASLEAMGYDVAAGLFSASETGASHKRERVFILALADGQPLEHADSGGLRASRLAECEPPNIESASGKPVGDSSGARLPRRSGQPGDDGAQQPAAERASLPYAPPGPADADGWRWVLERWPGLAPAISDLDHADAIGQQGINGREDGAARHGAVVEAGHEAGGQKAQRELCRVADERAHRLVGCGLQNRVDRLRAMGNGVVPTCASVAFIGLWASLKGNQ